jgi:hydroxymethylpyrimidine/phosphomethylpyrimidine kinase
MSAPVVLTIAGSDSGGGAGIQADVRTFTLLNVLGATAITAITAQNTVGVHNVYALDTQTVRQQIEAVLGDMPVVAVKTGMLATQAIAELVATYDFPNLVIDPVMLSSSGHELVANEALETYRSVLIPRARVVTPNAAEAARLTESAVNDIDDMERAGRVLQALGPNTVVVTGGELGVDVVVDGANVHVLKADPVQTRNTHGTGCTFSAAIAAFFARGQPVLNAVEQAKAFTHEALVNGKDQYFGSSTGPVWSTSGPRTRDVEKAQY